MEYAYEPGLLPESAELEDVWPKSDAEMLVLKGLVKELLRLQPDSPLNRNRQYVLDNWPRVRPIF